MKSHAMNNSYAQADLTVVLPVAVLVTGLIIGAFVQVVQNQETRADAAIERALGQTSLPTLSAKARPAVAKPDFFI